MKDSIIIQFFSFRGRRPLELDIPVDISAEELIRVLNDVYRLGMDPARPQEFHLQAENPIVLLRGSRTIREFGLHDGSRLYCAKDP